VPRRALAWPGRRAACDDPGVDHPLDDQSRQAPGAPVRAGVPEHGRVPKYYAVKTHIAALIEELGEGGLLPTERDLALRYEVARETVRQALRDLLLEGRLRRQGRGTVVAGPKLEQPLSLASYTEGVRRQGRMPGRSLISLDRFPCTPALTAATGAAEGEPVWHMERVLLADEERVGLESTYVSVARVPGLDADFDPDSSFYAYLRERLGVEFGAADERIETVLATPREALLIGTPPALPMLLMHRVSRDTAGRPFERVRTLFRGDRFSFTARLSGAGQARETGASGERGAVDGNR
jgi:GntR family transcriptional regulator